MIIQFSSIKTFLNENSTPTNCTFEMLSTSATTGIVCPGTYPVYGNETMHVKGPDLHQQQQKYFSKFTLTGA